jgi:hypothetical protein
VKRTDDGAVLRRGAGLGKDDFGQSYLDVGTDKSPFTNSHLPVAVSTDSIREAGAFPTEIESEGARDFQRQI